MFRYDLYGKTFDCAWNGGVKWMYSSSLMRVKVLENMSQYKVKQAVKKKKHETQESFQVLTWRQCTWKNVYGISDWRKSFYLHSYPQSLWQWSDHMVRWLLSMGGSDLHGFHTVVCTWRRDACGTLLLAYFLTAVCWSIYMYQCINGTWKQLETFYVYVYFQ